MENMTLLYKIRIFGNVNIFKVFCFINMIRYFYLWYLLGRGEKIDDKCILKYFDYIGIEVGREKNKGDFERSCNSCYDK